MLLPLPVEVFARGHRVQYVAFLMVDGLNGAWPTKALSRQEFCIDDFDDVTRIRITNVQRECVRNTCNGHE